MDTETFIAKYHNSLVFFREFAFSSTKFTPPGAPEVEFADGVVQLGNTLVIFQMKERAKSDAGNADDERRWFDDKVAAKGTRQIRDTLRYLSSGNEILVTNDRGDTFNIAADSYAEIFKIVLYDRGENLPQDCSRKRFHVSKTAGFIHIMDARDYLGMTRVLRAPQEVLEYLRFREDVLIRYPEVCSTMTERALAGHFIEGDQDKPPSMATADAIDRLADPGEDWDISPIIMQFRERIVYGDPDNKLYYNIVRELSMLPRSAWRAIKERFDLCVRNVQEDRFERPYRLAHPATDCGIVLASATSELTTDPNWSVMRVNAVENFAIGHKYELRLGKCIGVLIAKNGDHIEIHWSMVEHAWVEDPAIQAWLDENNPFRPLSDGRKFGYFTRKS